ncbi:MAG: M13 family metallopeptidase N-terminal domain-containing protein [Chthoniobacterales bacterium]
MRAQSDSSPAPAAGTPLDKNPPPLNPANMDTSVKPGDNFYRYANGNWLKNNPVPPEYSRWGSFNELIEKNNDALHEIAEKASATAAREESESKPGKAVNNDVQKVGDFYASGMNEGEINAARVQPLQDEIKHIDAIKDRAALTKEIGHLHSIALGRSSALPPARTTRTARWSSPRLARGDLACLIAITTRRTMRLRRSCASNTSRM